MNTNLPKILILHPSGSVRNKLKSNLEANFDVHFSTVSACIESPESNLPGKDYIVVMESAQSRDLDLIHLVEINGIQISDLADQCLHYGLKRLIYFADCISLSRSVNPTQLAIDAEGDPYFWTDFHESIYQAVLALFRAEAEGLEIQIIYHGLCSSLWPENSFYRDLFLTQETQSGGTFPCASLDFILERLIQTCSVPSIDKNQDLWIEKYNTTKELKVKIKEDSKVYLDLMDPKEKSGKFLMGFLKNLWSSSRSRLSLLTQANFGESDKKN